MTSKNVEFGSTAHKHRIRTIGIIANRNGYDWFYQSNKLGMSDKFESIILSDQDETFILYTQLIEWGESDYPIDEKLRERASSLRDDITPLPSTFGSNNDKEVGFCVWSERFENWFYVPYSTDTINCITDHERLSEFLG